MSAPPPPYPGTGKGPEPMYPQAQPAQGYPPQPYGGQPGQPGYGQTTVVVAQPAMTVVQTFRETPVHTRCPHCQAEVVTATQYETGTMAWIVCLVLCLVGCWPFCLIPFCVDGAKDVIHSCPNCKQVISRYNRV